MARGVVRGLLAFELANLVRHVDVIHEVALDPLHSLVQLLNACARSRVACLARGIERALQVTDRLHGLLLLRLER